MTVRELFEWEKEHDALDKEVRIQFRDDKGDHWGSSEKLYLIRYKNEIIL